MTIPGPTLAFLKQITRQLSDVILELYPLVDPKTISKLNNVNSLVGKLKSSLDEGELPTVPVFSDVNALAEALIRRRKADEQAWKELLNESAKGQ